MVNPRYWIPIGGAEKPRRQSRKYPRVKYTGVRNERGYGNSEERK